MVNCKGAKKRASGYICFAETRRHRYEAQMGKKINIEDLVQMVAAEWESLDAAEKEYWKTQAKQIRSNIRRKEPSMPRYREGPQTACNTSSNFRKWIANAGRIPPDDEDLEDENARKNNFACPQVNKPKDRFSLLKSLRAEQTNLVNRFNEDARSRFREIFTDKLIWNEPEPLKILTAKFALLTVLCEPDPETYYAVPKEFTIVKVRPADNFDFVVRRFILRQSDASTTPYSREFGVCDFSMNDGESRIPPPPPYGLRCSDVKTFVCSEHEFVRRLNTLLVDCWNQVLLVPVVQFQAACWCFKWLKNRREALLKRPTKSVTLERIICMEDFLIVVGHLASSGEKTNPSNAGESGCGTSTSSSGGGGKCQSPMGAALGGGGMGEDDDDEFGVMPSIGMSALQISDECRTQRDGRSNQKKMVEETYGRITEASCDYFFQNARRFIYNSAKLRRNCSYDNYSSTSPPY